LTDRLAPIWLSLSLAINDLRHDRRVAATMVVAIAAILAPLLLLLGLKTGIIETAKQQLLNDPRNLEVRIYQNARLGRDWFTAMAAQPGIRFVIPRTRSINATIDLVTERRKILQSVEMIPTDKGDPLLPPGTPVLLDHQAVLLSAPAAEALGLTAGDAFTGALRRRVEGRDERIQLKLGVVAVLPENRLPREAVFVSLEFLLAAEDYRDGYRVGLFDVDSGQLREGVRKEFANARLYAAGLDEVLSLAATLRSQGLEIRTRAAEIRNVKAMDRVLTFVFAVIAAIASVGGAIALGANVWINVERKRRDLALLRLMGMPDMGVLLVPVWQALATAIGAFALAYIAYLAGAATFNHELSSSLPDQGYACILNGPDIVAMFALAVLIAMIASSVAGLRATRLDPAECLRESV